MNQPSKLERALFVWNALNAGIAIWIFFNVPLQIFGRGVAAFLPIAIGVAAAGFLLWRLLKPTRFVLAFGALFWALQIVTVQLPDALYAFHLGLSFNYRLSDDPDCVVSINILAIIVAALFVTAAIRHPKEEILPAGP